MHKIWLLIALIMLIPSSFAESNQNLKIYTEDTPNILVNVQQPQFIIKLKSNPSTGYSWFLREHDDALVQPIKHQFEKNPQASLMGAPGYEIWTFKIKPQGFAVPQQSTLRFVYARPNQGSDGSSQLVFHITTESH